MKYLLQFGRVFLGVRFQKASSFHPKEKVHPIKIKGYSKQKSAMARGAWSSRVGSDSEALSLGQVETEETASVPRRIPEKAGK